MQYNELVQRIQTKAGLTDRGQAAALARAVVTALEERTTPGLAQNLASQLPEELKAGLPDRPSQTLGGGAEAFVQRVEEIWQQREPGAHGARCVKAALDALTEAVSPGQIENVLGQLPSDLDRLVGAEVGGQGRLGN
jgi:uncharacterized protein (DUF2267 family)